ncbi:alpha/beta hydrolase [Sphingomonas sp.]|uniref:alpha/beta hydrolase n=1 Tax=Sphingomonas sp. TaxID=28214 RepID=UPI003B3A6F61
MTWTALAAALLLCPTAIGAATHPVDDSYTVARRFESYRQQYPGIAWPNVAPRTGQTIAFDLVYKSLGERDLHIDVFSPPPHRQRHQGLLLVHGGAWRSGSKAHFYALANLLAQRGYTVFLPEYRLAPEAPYPAGMEDIGDALAWAQDHAAIYRLSSDRIALGGASSGGQMAALLAYRGTMASPDRRVASRPNALIDLDGVLDATDPLALRYENAKGPESPLAQWLGGAFEQVPATWREASAAHHVGPGAPPTLIVSSGMPRFTAGRDHVLTTLRDHGIRAAFYSYDKAPHDFWLFQPFLDRLVDRIDNFLRAVDADQTRRTKR